MTDYSNTIIYKIICKDDNIKDIYIGHTTNFINRHSSHKQHTIESHYRDYNMPLYQFIRENGGWNNFTMDIIETFSCKNKFDATIKEAFYIRTLKASLNKIIPHRTRNEYYVDNKSKLIEKSTKWYNENKDYRLEYAKDYSKNNKEKIAEYQKQYRIENKDNYNKYRQENKDKIKQQRRERYHRKKEQKLMSLENKV